MSRPTLHPCRLFLGKRKCMSLGRRLAEIIDVEFNNERTLAKMLIINIIIIAIQPDVDTH